MDLAADGEPWGIDDAETCVGHLGSVPVVHRRGRRRARHRLEAELGVLEAENCPSAILAPLRVRRRGDALEVTQPFVETGGGVLRVWPDRRCLALALAEVADAVGHLHRCGYSHGSIVLAALGRAGDRLVLVDLGDLAPLDADARRVDLLALHDLCSELLELPRGVPGASVVGPTPPGAEHIAARLRSLAASVAAPSRCRRHRQSAKLTSLSLAGLGLVCLVLGVAALADRPSEQGVGTATADRAEVTCDDGWGHAAPDGACR
ncbi:MAG: hypothetical protein JJU45_04370 [Acidimicrobiia bacterium]|nr:hypothetical protein [Acidimicrobiia bacterium]